MDDSLNSFKWTDPTEKVQHSALEKQADGMQNDRERALQQKKQKKKT